MADHMKIENTLSENIARKDERDSHPFSLCRTYNIYSNLEAVAKLPRRCCGSLPYYSYCLRHRA